MTEMHVIASQAGWQEMARHPGVGYIHAWLLRMGRRRVCFHHLHGDDWQSLRGAQLFIGEASELMPVAVAHGRRLGAGAQGELQVIGAQALSIDAPKRTFWRYHRQGSPIVLLPIGDLVHQRNRWLECFLVDRPRPLHLTPCSDVPDVRLLEVEPGLYAHVEQAGDANAVDDATPYLNHDGSMPEEQLLRILSQRGWGLRCAESCTAGGLAARVARIPGASRVLDAGVVTYSNAAKMRLLGVRQATLEQHGAVSEAVVREMVQSLGDEKHMALALSGVAGPDGGTPEKPVGTIWVAISTPNMPARAFRLSLHGSRTSIQAQAAMHAIVEACLCMKI